MTAPIEDAVRLVRANPRFRNIKVTRRDDGSILLAAECDVQLPSTWKAIGQSPSGIRSWESVEILFPTKFPLHIPLITLREDLPTDLPHINYLKNADRIHPCLVHGSLREALHTEGMERLLLQLFEWLERAASGELIDEDFGWEPTRRTDVSDLLYLDVDATANNAPPLGGFNLVQLNVIQADTASCAWVARPFPKKRLDNTDAIKFAKTNVAFQDGTSKSIGTIAGVFWPYADADGQIATDSTFKPDSVSTLSDLVARASECQLDVTVRRFFENVASAFFLDAPRSISQPIYAILAVRRPFHILGYETEFELIAYRIDWPIRQLSPVEVDALPVRPVAILSVISKELLRKTSGLTVQNAGFKTAILGCGSLGSKIALHLSRAGYLPSLFIDSDYFSAHNSARHALVPEAAFSVSSKADQVGKICAQFSPEEAVKQWPWPIEEVTEIPGSRETCLYDPNALLINTTASNSVRTFLSQSDIQSRVTEATALNLGRNAVMTTEGPSKNPSSEDLMAYAYEKMRDAGILQTQDSANQSPLRVGVGCNSITLPMADSQLSLIAAAVAQALLQYQEKGIPDIGRLAIGQLGNDGMSLVWMHWPLGATQLADRSDTDGWTIRVLDNAHQKIAKEVAAHPRVETGGLIVGRISPVCREAIIVDVLPAPADSVRTSVLFELGVEGRAELIARYDTSGKGVLWCLGTWHSHLDAVGPSPTDIKTAESIKGELKRAAILLIHRPDGYSAVVKPNYD